MNTINKDTKIASKVKLVLSYIDEINTETGKPLFSNKVKNQKLHYWKKESKNRKNSFLNSKFIFTLHKTNQNKK